MFQLIVAVISIALVAALAIASIFYGGDAFTKSSEKANVTTLVNQGQQIAGAYQLYKTDTGASEVDVATLVDQKYLAVNPTPSKIATGTWAIVSEGTGAALKRYAQIGFASSVDAAALCDTVEATKGEVIKQNGQCDATADNFRFPL